MSISVNGVSNISKLDNTFGVKNTEQAISYFEKASNKGNQFAQYVLGKMYGTKVA